MMHWFCQLCPNINESALAGNQGMGMKLPVHKVQSFFRRELTQTSSTWTMVPSYRNLRKMKVTCAKFLSRTAGNGLIRIDFYSQVPLLMARVAGPRTHAHTLSCGSTPINVWNVHFMSALPSPKQTCPNSHRSTPCHWSSLEEISYSRVYPGANSGGRY